jgi:hypothetical protein
MGAEDEHYMNELGQGERRKASIEEREGTYSEELSKGLRFS